MEKTDQPKDERGKIFVGGLSWDTTQASLLSYFSRFGEVKECVVVTNPATGKSRGFGFVTFADPACVETVQAAAPHILDGKQIDPNGCNRKKTGRGPKANENGKKKLFIGGLPANVDEAQLREGFSKYGKINDVVIVFDQAKQRPRGFGFMTFESEESVDKIVRERFVQICGKQVECKRAEPRDVQMAQEGSMAALSAGSPAMMMVQGPDGSLRLVPTAGAAGGGGHALLMQQPGGPGMVNHADLNNHLAAMQHGGLSYLTPGGQNIVMMGGVNGGAMTTMAGGGSYIVQGPGGQNMLVSAGAQHPGAMHPGALQLATSGGAAANPGLAAAAAGGSYIIQGPNGASYLVQAPAAAAGGYLSAGGPAAGQFSAAAALQQQQQHAAAGLVSMAGAPGAGQQYLMAYQGAAAAAAAAAQQPAAGLDYSAAYGMASPYGVPLSAANLYAAYAKAGATMVDGNGAAEGAGGPGGHGEKSGGASFINPYSLELVNGVGESQQDGSAAAAAAVRHAAAVAAGGAGAQAAMANEAAAAAAGAGGRLAVGPGGVGYYLLPGAGLQSQVPVSVGGLTYGGAYGAQLFSGAAGVPADASVLSASQYGRIASSHAAIAQAYHPYRR